MPLKYNPDLWPASWILELIAAGRLHDFYISGLWKAVRRKVLKDCRHRCYDCERKSPAVISLATTAHHVNELRARPDLALSIYDENGQVNIIGLCASCHWNRHHKRVVPVTDERW